MFRLVNYDNDRIEQTVMASKTMEHLLHRAIIEVPRGQWRTFTTIDRIGDINADLIEKYSDFYGYVCSNVDYIIVGPTGINVPKNLIKEVADNLPGLQHAPKKECYAHECKNFRKSGSASTGYYYRNSPHRRGKRTRLVSEQRKNISHDNYAAEHPEYRMKRSRNYKLPMSWDLYDSCYRSRREKGWKRSKIRKQWMKPFRRSNIPTTDTFPEVEESHNILDGIHDFLHFIENDAVAVEECTYFDDYVDDLTKNERIWGVRECPFCGIQYLESDDHARFNIEYISQTDIECQISTDQYIELHKYNADKQREIEHSLHRHQRLENITTELQKPSSTLPSNTDQLNYCESCGEIFSKDDMVGKKWCQDCEEISYINEMAQSESDDYLFVTCPRCLIKVDYRELSSCSDTYISDQTPICMDCRMEIQDEYFDYLYRREDQYEYDLSA